MDSQQDGCHQKGIGHCFLRGDLSLHPHLSYRKEQTPRPSHNTSGRVGTQEYRRAGILLIFCSEY
jgi:hypothetical protein